jgi:hypothetical protein
VVARSGDDAPPRAQAGAGSSAPPSPDPFLSSSRSPSLSPSSGASPVPSALPPADLEGRLLVPGGDFRLVPDEKADGGDLTVQELAALEGKNAKATEEGLRTLGFQAARAHAYESDDAVVLVLVTQFRSPGSAQALLKANRDLDAGRPFRSTTVPGAYTTEEDLPEAVRQSGQFTRGPYLYFLGRLTETRESDTKAFDALLKQQRDLAERSDP